MPFPIFTRYETSLVVANNKTQFCLTRDAFLVVFGQRTSMLALQARRLMLFNTMLYVDTPLYDRYMVSEKLNSRSN